ncbi:MAG TPA: fibronectin type III domain-containing protein [Patescibacteria group bacterium]
MRNIVLAALFVLLIASNTALALVGVPGGTPDYFGSPNWSNSPIIHKFVDSLPPLGCTTPNNLGQCIPVANPDTITYPGTDYYEIRLVEYSEKMHTELLATKLRGYVQINNGTDANGANTILPAPVHYMGPFIKATRDRPVRIKFINALPTGTGGDLFIPVDMSVMGAGMGSGGMGSGNYTQNRATIHLHGGHTPWISDGTPHQWTTPAGEGTAYPKGVSVSDVPDMPASGAGALTFFYTNQQGATLLFYHDHSYGITRLNVYGGEVAGYLISDVTEQNLIATGKIPSEQIPLVIQDKSFVSSTTATTDPTWDSAKWGGSGSLWFPHVYMTNQNPNLLSGINPFGRWDYGPWFWPPVTTAAGLVHGPVACANNPAQTCPGTPDVSMVMEAFMDTPVVNGTAYPYVVVQPKAYRFRILNGSNDRFWNLSLFYADPLAPTEVKMVPAVAGTWPAGWPTPDSRAGGWPDPTTVGPSMIQIGNESGFLPAPVVLTNIPIGYDRDVRSITVGNIKEHNLFLGPAERADVIIDFSAVPNGSTLILYNDSPAPVPAGDARVDYYTGNPNLTAVGGAPTTLAGFGPNIRTVMQFRVSGTVPAPPFSLTALQAAMPAAYTASQLQPVVNQTAYGGTTDVYARIQDTSLTFTPAGSLTPTTISMQPKAIQELFELDYGRMNSVLGVELPLTNFAKQTTIPLGYIDPPTEIFQDGQAQVWKVTHNGVDTHAIHFHLFDVQLINRVDWAGVIKPPDPNELGWKETIRMNPLEDVIVAIRPATPKVPFLVPNNSRYLNPTMPANDTMGFAQIDPNTGNPMAVSNQIVSFFWEYMWHCHLLGHEEMDMMRPIVFQPGAVSTYVIPGPPAAPSAVAGNANATVSFTAPAPNGGNPVTSYVVTSTPGNVTATGATSPITISGLLNGTIYTFNVAAVNSAGTGLSSLPTNQVMPVGPSTYTITITAGLNGSITPGGIAMVTQGTNQAFAITPATGYHVANVLVDGVSVGAVTTYTFTNVVANHTISATFAINTYTITATSGLNGSITPPGITTLNYGASQIYSFAPSLGYSIGSLTVDGVAQPIAASYTFTSIAANHTIDVTFTINTFTITSSAGLNGSITPLGATTVSYGAAQAYIITPAIGYHVLDVLVDGVSVGAVTTYSFLNVTTTHTISATFAINTFAITATAGVGGTVTPAGTTSVNYGAAQAYTITPNIGYGIASITVDGVAVTPISPYTFTNVTASHAINATFSINTFTLTVSATAGGTITPSGILTANYGTGQAFTVTPSIGYHITSVTDNGTPMAAPYALSNITSSHMVVANFAIDTFSLTINAGPGGTIQPLGVTILTYGVNATYTAVPDPGFHIVDVTVDGISQGPIMTYTFISPTASHTIGATFAINASPVYRFWSNVKQHHFFTISETEKNYVIANDPSWQYQGIAWYAYVSQQPNSAPVHRFWSASKQGHFFTISEAEKNSVIATDPSWQYQGIAWYAYVSQQPNSAPVHRFWSETKQGHFFTISEAEKNYVIANDPSWQYQGIAWYTPLN